MNIRLWMTKTAGYFAEIIVRCLVWFKDLIDISEFSSGGADLYIRLANAELGEEETQTKLIVSLALICFIIMAAIVFGLYKLRANRKGKSVSFCVFFTILLFTLLLLSLVSRAVEVHDITPLRPLAQGQTLVSAGNVFELGFFSPNNSANKYLGIWYKHILPRKVVWVANREKPLAVTDTLAVLTISSNGNLELVAVYQLIGTCGRAFIILVTHFYRECLLVIWINGSTPYWRIGPWDKSKFIGVPGMDDQYRSGFNLEDNAQQGTKYFSFNLFAKTIEAFMDVSSEGVLRLIYTKHSENWRTFWEAPAAKNPCDKYGACGPFGVCKSSESPICKCLKGFVPKSHEEWSRGNRAEGCVRQAKLFCESTTSQSVASRGNEDVFEDVKCKTTRFS
ncbi:unnamed protein product [Malus baccata var. baccata]